VRATDLADVPVLRRLQARLAYARVEPEVAHQLARRGEAGDITDGGQEANRDGCVHSRDRQQALQLRIREYGLPERSVDDGEILPKAIQFPQALLDGNPLIERQWLLSEPPPALLAKEIGRRAARDQVRGQYRVDLVLKAGALTHDLRPASDLPTQRLGAIISDPDLGQEAARVELREHSRVDLVSLDPRLRDQTHLQRVGDDHPSHVRLKGGHDRGGVSGRLEDDVIRRPQAARILCECRTLQRHTSACADPPVLEIRDLGDGARDIESNNSHGAPPWCVGGTLRDGEPWAARQLRIRARGATGQVAGAASY
jgi:hypothetical protein